MKKLSLVATALLFSLSNLTFAASIHSLNQAEMTKIFQDKTATTISLATSNGKLIENAFSGYFAKDGKVQGQFASKLDNDPQSDTGNWAVKPDGSLCVIWQHWTHSKPICVAGYQLENGVVLVNKETNNLETVILDENIKAGNQLKS